MAGVFAGIGKKSGILNWNLFGSKKPAGEVKKKPLGPMGVPMPQGYASQVGVAPEPDELGDIVRDMDADYQVSYARRVLAAQIAAVEVTISVEGSADPRAEAIAAKLQELWQEAVTAMQESIGYGRKAFEKCWGYDVSQNISFIRKLDPMEFEDSKLRLAERGRFDGIDVKVVHEDKSEDWEPLCVENSWWLALDATGKYPHGRSRYFPAVNRSWKAKRDTLQNLDRFIRRFAIRGGVAHIPFQLMDPETGRLEDTAEKFQQAMEALYSGGTAVFPNDLHPTDEGKYLWDFTGDATTLDPGPLLSVITAQDVWILRGLGIPEKTVTEGEAVGSFAMVSNQMLTLFAVVDSILSQFAGSFNRYVAEPHRAANYGESSGPTFKATYPSLTTRPDGFVVEVVKLLLANPTFIQGIVEGAVDLRQMLQTAGIPLVDGFEEIMRNVAGRMAAATGAAPAGTDPAAGAGGEFGGVSRLQWKRNRQAINDLLVEFMQGASSEAYTLTMLQTLGLSAATAQSVLDDAKDGNIDNPETGNVAMSNVKIPDAGRLSVPDQDALLAEAMREFESLFDELIDAMVAGQNARVAGIRDELIELQAAMRAASRVLGMLSPFAPDINTYGDGDAAQVQSVITMANEIGGYRFPWLSKALDFLIGKKVLRASEFEKLSKADKRAVLSVPGVESEKTLKSIRTKLAKSIEDGTDLRSFRESIKDELALSRSQTETLYRTNVHQGYVSGFDAALKSPELEEEFPAVMYSASADTRVRDAHWDLDGFVCLRSDRAYRVLKEALSDYNCRCTLVPLSMEDAESRGIKTYSDLPSSVLDEYA